MLNEVDALSDQLGNYMTKTLLAMNKTWNGPPVAPHFQVFPKKRNLNDEGNPVIRVSEQESKVVAGIWLRHHHKPFSVETPTTEAYSQKGETDQSALTDITVYKDDGVSRLLNIELKALQPGEEAFRKDLEKLLREKVEGMWFHTLESADMSSWKAIGGKLWSSYLSLVSDEHPLCQKAMKRPKHAVRFRFVVLDPPKKPLDPAQAKDFVIRFGQWKEDLEERFPWETFKPKPKKTRVVAATKATASAK